MPAYKPISIKSVLLGEVVTFLADENMPCLITQDGVVELINQLAFYKEEGKPLFPEIYIFDDFELVRKVLTPFQFLQIGNGEKTKQTMLKALKKCAPLSEDGWSIYILRRENSFEYGIFRTGTSILSVSIAETLIDKGTDDLKAILIHQVSDKIVELKGVNAAPLIISYGTNDDAKSSPLENQYKFIEGIIEKVEPSIKEQVGTFYKKLFLNVLQKGHGTLACVIDDKKKELPKKLKDGIVLDPRIDAQTLIKNILTTPDLLSNTVLESNLSLAVGMMQSDGITVFTNSGEIAAFNVFVKHPEKISKVQTSGGARSRTFHTLCDMIGSGLEAAFIQSQDGKIEFKRNGK
jgi:hypothetical protein